MSITPAEFIKNHGLNPNMIDPNALAEVVAERMAAGIAGTPVDMPMIPCYLSDTGEIAKGAKAIVIDAGGTNFRRALAEYNGAGFIISHLATDKMPGTLSPVTFDQMIDFIAESILPIAGETDIIGFTFSYNVTITPTVDGIVNKIDKEVTVTDCEGKAVGAALSEALAKKGAPGKRVIILNDTVSAMLGGCTEVDMDEHSGVAGMICGTGLNSCCSVDGMIYNHESGCFSAAPSGDIDEAVDAESIAPGEKLMEKKASGVYLGKICRTAMKAACAEGLISSETLEEINKIENLDGAVVDAWAQGDFGNNPFASDEEMTFAHQLCTAIFARSARCAATIMIAIAILKNCGTDPAKPLCICAEGSLIAKSKTFRPYLDDALKDSGKYIDIVIGHETTLPGSAMAALMNS